MIAGSRAIVTGITTIGSITGIITTTIPPIGITALGVATDMVMATDMATDMGVIDGGFC